MEVKTASAEIALAASPSHADKSLEKNNGDGEEMDFEITMNDSDGEDDASSAPADKPVDKVVNGKNSSEDDDSQCSQPITRATRSKTRRMAAAEDRSGQNNDSVASEEGNNSTDTPQSSAKNKPYDREPESGETGDNENDKEKQAPGSDKEEMVDSEEEEIKKDKKELKDSGKNDEKENPEGDSGNREEEMNDCVGSPRVSIKIKDSEKTKNKKARDKKGPEDDDVVMIGDSPAKEPHLVSSTMHRPIVSLPMSSLGGVSVTSSLILNSRTGVTMPYISSMAGASFMPSVSGVQLMLPKGAPGSLMYLPNSSAFVSSSPLVFPTVTGSVSRNTNPMLLSHYGGFGGSNPVRSMMASSMIGKSNSHLAPVLSSMPNKPTSSIGMIDMIRWELENHINVKPKYAKPNPKAELGTLAKWHFDLGADLVKEYVYHDLVRIQLKRKDEGNLTPKEQDDFNKLQEIDKELNEKVGHLKFKLTKSCKCGFKTESANILHDHELRPHLERGRFFNCAICKFSCRQPNVFRFHMESVHARVAKIENKSSFYECPLCPYETNYTNRLEQHKTRCQRQFREAFNLHPSCMTGPEVNLSLENVFYFVFTRQFMNSIVPPLTSGQTAVKQVMSNHPKATRMGSTIARMASNAARMVSTNLMTPRNLAPRIPHLINQNQTSKASVANRNYPAISSQINTATNIRSPMTSTGPTSAQQQAANRMPTVPNISQTNSGFEVCEICGGYVKDRKALRIHFFYAHRIDMPFGVFERPQAPLYCATCFSRFWTAQGLQKHIEVHKNEVMSTTNNSNGVAGKCISCGHRVPNILMHMRMVHNRELRHYLAALMCIFCGQRCPTKQQVEQHMSKVHGVIVKNSGAVGGPNMTPIPPIAAPPINNPNPRVQPPPPAKPGNGKPGRTSQCVLCNLSFSRNVDLTRHCMRVHHTCMKCGLVVVDKESLSRHTCLHSASGMRTCQICGDTGFHPAYYIKHMRDRHLRKCSIVLRRIDRAVVETLKRPITISDSEEDEPISQHSRPKEAKVADPDSYGMEEIDDENEDKSSPVNNGDKDNAGANKSRSKACEKKNSGDISDMAAEQGSSQDRDENLVSSDKECEQPEKVVKEDCTNGESHDQEEDTICDEKSADKVTDDNSRDADEKSHSKSKIVIKKEICDENNSEVDADGADSDSKNEDKTLSKKRKLDSSKSEAPPSKKTARKSIRSSSNRVVDALTHA